MAIAEVLTVIGIALATQYVLLFGFRKAKEHDKLPIFWTVAILFFIGLMMIPL